MSMSMSTSIASPSADTRAVSQSSQLVAKYIFAGDGEAVEALLEEPVEGRFGSAQKEWSEVCCVWCGAVVWAIELCEGIGEGCVLFCAEKSIDKVCSMIILAWFLARTLSTYGE